VSARALFVESGGTSIIHFHSPLNLIFKFIDHLSLLYVLYTASYHEAIHNIWIWIWIYSSSTPLIRQIPLFWGGDMLYLRSVNWRSHKV